VLAAVAGFMNSVTGKAWPKQETIAREAGVVGTRGVQKALARAVKSGRLKVTVGHGRGNTNVYEIPDAMTNRRSSSADPKRRTAEHEMTNSEAANDEPPFVQNSGRNIRRNHRGAPTAPTHRPEYANREVEEFLASLREEAPSALSDDDDDDDEKCPF
jgi:hypothetical protein